MTDTLRRIRNPESLASLGKTLRAQREALALRQGMVQGMRQATISKIERGGDVNLDTLVSYANALGLEVALVPIGQPRAATAFKLEGASPSLIVPQDLLSQYADLRDVES